VEQTELACGNELSRDVTIASAADAAALAKIEVINGSVTLDASGLSELALPALSVVRGALEIRNQAALRHLAMPVLQSVAGQLAVIGDAQLASVELPLLTRVGSLVIDGNPALPDLTGMAALGNVPGDIQITNNGALTAADLPIRETVGSVTIDGNAQLGVVALSVDRLGPLHIGSNPVLTSVSLVPRDGGFVTLDRVTIAANPQLAVVSIITSTLASLAIDDNPALTDITVSSFFITGDLAIRGNGLASVTLSTPSLVEFELGGSLTLSGPITALHAERAIEALGDCTLDTTRLVTFDPVADGLTCQGALHVIGNAQLTRMPGLSVGGSLELRSNPVLTSLPFLVQHELAGDLIVADNAVLRDAPALERIDHVAGNVTITGNPALKGAFAAALVRIDGAAVFDGNDSLGDVGLAALRHVGSLSVSHSGLLTVLALPSLTEVSRIDVRGNPSLVELQLPRLRQADMGVFDNPHLPACAVDALFTGLLGDHQQSGNDDAAGCAP
ncbi:MAG: hypothetical protein ABIY55_18805, partial [Kofleriaceae bacterium]